jgi:hypothetical protein
LHDAILEIILFGEKVFLGICDAKPNEIHRGGSVPDAIGLSFFERRFR